MAIFIKTVEGRKALEEFISFPETLYKDNKYYVPALRFDERDTLNPKKNPSSSFCESELYLAYKDGRLVGRIAAIINRKANIQWNHQEVRFGWFDFIDDKEVSAALIAKVEEFGRSRGMEKIVGPLGFTDFDPEGMLVDGYDALSTMPLIYNHPYYPVHLDSLGFKKDADWIEYKIFIPEVLPAKMSRVSKIISERSNVHLRQLTSRIVREEDYGHKLFDLINETYKNLYNFTVLPTDLADKYLGFYLSILDLDYISVVENEAGECVGFAITMPSIAKELQQTRGRLFPFGWIKILRTLKFKKPEGAELLLIGVRPDYQNSGINALLVADIFRKFNSWGVKWAETNAILEDNTKNQTQFTEFDKEQKKRRRSYVKPL